MTEACGNPVSFETLADYLAGLLAETEEGEIESHLFRCASCSAEAERLASLQSAIATAIPYVLSPSRFSALERKGVVESVNAMTPGQTASVLYPKPGRLLVHRLGGVNLKRAERVSIEMRTTRGESIGRFEHVPFDRAGGEVLVACQAHFADQFPRETVFTVEIVSGAERQEAASYTVLHRLA